MTWSEEILARKALAEPYRTYMKPMEQKQKQMRELSLAPKETIVKELLKASHKRLSFNSTLVRFQLNWASSLFDQVKPFNSTLVRFQQK